MKASEVIERLQICIERYGDHELEVRNGAGDLSNAEAVFWDSLCDRFFLDCDPEVYNEELRIE